jgi:hypothetical protein
MGKACHPHMPETADRLRGAPSDTPGRYACGGLGFLFWLLTPDFCSLLVTALPRTAYCFLPTAYCFPPTAYCFPPSVMQHSKMRLWGVHFRLFAIPKWKSWLA